MNRNMVLKSASAEAQPEGNVLVRLRLEFQTSADMERDIFMELGEMLNRDVACQIELVQQRLMSKK